MKPGRVRQKKSLGRQLDRRGELSSINNRIAKGRVGSTIRRLVDYGGRRKG